MSLLRLNVSNLRWAFAVILVSSLKVNGKPTTNSFNQIDAVVLLDPTKVVCTNETTLLCQRCAKKTKSTVVYPWCCADHEGVREWCERYLYFGLP